MALSSATSITHTQGCSVYTLRHFLSLLLVIALFSGLATGCKSKEERAAQRKGDVDKILAELKPVADVLADEGKSCVVRFSEAGDLLKSDEALAKKLVGMVKPISDFPTEEDNKAVDATLKINEVYAACEAKIKKDQGPESPALGTLHEKKKRLNKKIKHVYKEARKNKNKTKKKKDNDSK